MDVTDQQCSDTGETALPRIARALGVSSESFLRAVIVGKDVPAPLTATVQASVLLNEFMRITDPDVRERCLEYVRKAAAREVGHAA